MGQDLSNTQPDLYKLAGRYRSERKTLGDFGQIKPRIARGAEQETDHLEITSGFIKNLLRFCFVLLAITLALYLIAVLYDARLSSGEYTSSTTPYDISIGLDRLSIPANAIRFDKQRHFGQHNKIELYRHWPSLSGFTDSLASEFSAANNNDNLIFITLEKRNMMLDMSGRVTTIYEQFFEGDGEMQPYGLMRQGLSASGGYIDEDLYYAINSPYPFATRCIKDSEALIRPFCIRDVQIGKSMMLTYRFHKKLLPQWVEVDQAINAHVKSMMTNL